MTSRITLTQMERVVLHLTASGQSAARIASRLLVDTAAVDDCRIAIYEKLGLYGVSEGTYRRVLAEYDAAHALPSGWQQPTAPKPEVLRPKVLRPKVLRPEEEPPKPRAGCDSLPECAQRRAAGTPCCSSCGAGRARDQMRRQSEDFREAEEAKDR